MTTYTVLPQDDSQYDVTVTDTATYTVTAQDDSDLDVTITDTKAVTITLQPVTISGSGGVISVNGLTGAPTGVVVLDTDNILEGDNNLYYTDARVDAWLQSGSVTEVDIGGYTLTKNTDEDTLDLTLENGVVLQVGQEQHFYAKASEAISNGDVVMFSGAQGNHLLISKADMSAQGFMPSHVIGVATQDFANNQFGYVTDFGKVRGLDTSSYSEGDILYLSPTVAGAFTTTEPTPSQGHAIEVAAVTRSHQNHGTIFVRPTHNPDTDEVAEGSTNLYYTDARVQSVIDTNTAGFITDYDPTEADITEHQAALTITESQISDLQNYLTDYTVTEGDVTQHQAALTITESQISDLTHFSGSYNDLTDKDNFNTITLDGNNFLTVEGNFTAGGGSIDASANSKFIPLNLDSFSGLGGNYGNLSDMFLANTWGTDGGHNVARIAATGTADDGTHNTQLVLHGNAYNVINSWDVPTANSGVRKPLVLKSNQHFIDSDNSEGLVAKFRHESTPAFQDESKILVGWRKDDGTSIFGGTIATMYDSGDNWEFKFQGMDPDNDSTFNNLTIRKDYIYSDYPFKMTGYDNAGLASLSTNSSGALIWNTEDTKLEVYDGNNWTKMAMLGDTKDITLDDNSFLTVTGNFSAGGGAVDLSATGKYVPVNLSPLGGSIGTTDWFLAHTWGTDGGYSVGRLVAIGSSDDGSHNSALVLQGSNANQIKSLDGNYNHKPLEIDSDKLKAPETSLVVNTTASEGGVLPLKIVRNNTDGGSTINDDSKVDVSFQIANGDSDYDNATFIGGFSAVYDTTNGNSFRLYVDPNQEATNPGTNSHEMQVHEDFFQISRPMQFSNYITSSVPPAADHNTRVIYVADGNQGSPCLAISDGSDWRVLATVGNVISIS